MQPLDNVHYQWECNYTDADKLYTVHFEFNTFLPNKLSSSIIRPEPIMPA